MAELGSQELYREVRGRLPAGACTVNRAKRSAGAEDGEKRKATGSEKGNGVKEEEKSVGARRSAHRRKRRRREIGDWLRLP